MTKIDYSIIPEHMRAGAKAYIENGVQAGGFLTAILFNDFARAYYSADAINRKAMGDWARWLCHGGIPHQCWGSVEKVVKWTSHNGLEGGAKE